QAEDGIRDLTVTGVQTCALPISQKAMFSKLIPLLAVPALSLAQTPPPVQDTTLHPISVQEAVRLAQEGNVAAVTSTNQIRSFQKIGRASCREGAEVPGAVGARKK